MEKFGTSFLDDLTKLRNFKSKRISSWDRTGKNYDWLHMKPHSTYTIAEIEGPGCIKHFYMIPFSLELFYYRKTILRIFWDGESQPSVEVPLGDFFGIGNCLPRYFTSLLLTVNPGDPNLGTQGINSYFPMPFRKSARIEIINESDIPFDCIWYHIDYQLYEEIDDVAYFHAQFRRESPTITKGEAEFSKNEPLWEGINDTGKDNYVFLDTEGNGQIVGVFFNVDNIAGKWWGEGDDMIFIDGEVWPPSFHGTGTEEIFGGGACPADEYAGPYTGFPLISNKNFSRKSSMYRWYIPDPIRFYKSIRMTIEHGHANNYENDYSSVVYWYQEEPHKNFPTFPSANERIPFLIPGEQEVAEKHMNMCIDFYKKAKTLQGEPQGSFPQKQCTIYILPKIGMVRDAFFQGKYDYALKELKELHDYVKQL